MRGFEDSYDRRLEALASRRAAPVEFQTKSGQIGNLSAGHARPKIFELYEKLPDEGSAVRYTVGAMARIDPEYTQITFEQGDRVKNQLDKALREADATCDFEYQGSATNDTHIRTYSDIDLLAITTRFHTLEPPQEPDVPYEGDPVKDLTEIRQTSGKHLRQAFPKAEVDETGAKSVTISGGSLRRKIDVVPANWYNTNDFAMHQAKRFRAIQVLDAISGKRLVNTPFMHNYLIEMLDRSTVGGLRKVIRLMKSLKYDSSTISLSSYDLTAIGYNMPEYELATCPGEEIALLARLKGYLDRLATNPHLILNMQVPDGSRKVFADGHATMGGLNELRTEVDDLVEAVCHNRQKSFAKLAEARVSY